MKTIVVIQARMGSTRLPRKVMMDLGGEPMLVRVVNRAQRIEGVEQVVVATTRREEDNAIVRLCNEREWPVFRGSEDDVLDRYYRCANAYDAKVVMRITSDCPVIDPALAGRVLREFLERQPDVHYATTSAPIRTFPRGLDVEVIRVDALDRSWEEDDNPAWREHVTQYIKNRPDLFAIQSVTHTEDLSHHRWTVDTPEDLDLMQRVYDCFPDDEFTWQEVLTVLGGNPEWMDLNRHIEQKSIEMSVFADMEFAENTNALVVAAHPDDEVLGAGGTIRKMVDAGVDVHVAFVATGISSRYADTDSDTETIDKQVARLKHDAIEAAAILGVSGVEFFDFIDQELDAVGAMAVTHRLRALGASFRPDLVLTHHHGDYNWDHRIVHEATLMAFRADPGERGPAAVWTYEVPSSTERAQPSPQSAFCPTIYVDVSLTMPAKIAAMSRYRSERRSFPHPRSRKALEAKARVRGSEAGLTAAEAFCLVREIR